MVLRRPGRNRSFNRENPDILIMMIAVDQIIRGCEQDKGDGTERKGMGTLKPATKSKWFLHPRAMVSLSPPPGFLLCGYFFLLSLFSGSISSISTFMQSPPFAS
ncbi:unnamed protein product [Citrullus colocynthis]|uniref:Uncharacterized protein n=1 Tax=Citrullus colocynthis TaxID=252529 RepID=A0ABP0XWC7_9ROSI